MRLTPQRSPSAAKCDMKTILGAAKHELLGIDTTRREARGQAEFTARVEKLCREPTSPFAPCNQLRGRRLANMHGRADAELKGDEVPRSRVLTSKLVAEIARQCRTRGTRCVVALLPSVNECGDARIPSLAAKYARVLEEVRAEGAEVVDLLPAFRERDYRSLYYPQDQHFTAAGHRAVAEALGRLFGS